MSFWECLVVLSTLAYVCLEVVGAVVHVQLDYIAVIVVLFAKFIYIFCNYHSRDTFDNK